MKLFDRPAPRYTSYPTAPEWAPLSPAVYAEKLGEIDDPLSLYFHIPFCHSMCLYCGCSVVLNRKPENEERYVEALCKEMELVHQHLGRKAHVTQLHFGGGTPTKLSEELFTHLFTQIQSHFALDFSREIAIEIDPRTVVADNGKKLRLLRALGFNRVSFGVQDTNPKVQEAVKRRQSLEMTEETYRLARTLEFDGINLDLIYGLPYQTEATFAETVDHILSMRPDRIALFSYAKVPWLKPHQKAIKDETLPSPEEKFAIYSAARERFIANGYVAIGMDHFAREGDEIEQAYRNGTLQRNFQGYTVAQATEMLGLGVTSIGFAGGAYFQNEKTLAAYYAALDQNTLPITRGKVLSEEDHLRKWVIHTLMCTFSLDKHAFETTFHTPFDAHFEGAKETLFDLEDEGLVINTPDTLFVTPEGELFIRIIATTFDAYLKPEPTPKFSQSI